MYFTLIFNLNLHFVDKKTLIVTIDFIADSSINIVNLVNFVLAIIYLDMILILFYPSGSQY